MTNLDDDIYIPNNAIYPKVTWESDFFSRACVAGIYQREQERASLILAKMAKELTESKNVCVAGGSFLNCNSNEKILNSIRIQILNPDLTNVTLQANSSILIKITRPMEKQTVLLNNISNSMKENALQAQVQKEAQAAQAASKKKAKTKVKKA